MRIVTLLPAATEIIALLGSLDHLVGISHECDFPAAVNSVPRVTHCPLYDAGLSSAEIDRRVREALATDGTLYRLNEPLLRELRPGFILTQQLCDVCAVGYGSVAALAASLPTHPVLVNLEPKCLADIFENIRHVGEALGVKERAEDTIANLEKRVAAVRTKAAKLEHRPKVFLMEWIDPPFCSGHWGPEIVRIVVIEEGNQNRQRLSLASMACDGATQLRGVGSATRVWVHNRQQKVVDVLNEPMVVAMRCNFRNLILL